MMIRTKILLSLALACCAATLTAQQPSYDNDMPRREIKAPAFNKAYVEYFKLLAAGKWQKAEKQRDKILQKVGRQQPLFDMGDALLLSSDDKHLAMGHDCWRAMELVASNYNPLTTSAVNELLAHRDINLSIDEIKATVVSALYTEVRKQKDEAAYDRFLVMAQGTTYESQALREREEVAYKKTMKSYLADDYARYLDKYGQQNPGHAAKVEEKYAIIDFNNLDYSVATCEAYLKKHPGSAKAATVEERLGECAYAELIGDNDTEQSLTQWLQKYDYSPYAHEVRERLYTLAYNKYTGSMAGCRHYIDTYPASPYTERMRQELYTLAFAELERDESLQACDRFLTDYPGSPYDEQVRNKRNKWEYQAVKEQESTEALQQFIDTHPGSPYLEIARHDLKILQSGGSLLKSRTPLPAPETETEETPAGPVVPDDAR